MRANTPVPADTFFHAISHTQVLTQCELMLNAKGLNVAHEAFVDTAGAAEHAAAGGL